MYPNTYTGYCWNHTSNLQCQFEDRACWYPNNAGWKCLGCIKNLRVFPACGGCIYNEGCSLDNFMIWGIPNYGGYWDKSPTATVKHGWEMKICHPFKFYCQRLCSYSGYQQQQGYVCTCMTVNSFANSCVVSTGGTWCRCAAQPSSWPYMGCSCTANWENFTSSAFETTVQVFPTTACPVKIVTETYSTCFSSTYCWRAFDGKFAHNYGYLWNCFTTYGMPCMATLGYSGCRIPGGSPAAAIYWARPFYGQGLCAWLGFKCTSCYYCCGCPHLYPQVNNWCHSYAFCCRACFCSMLCGDQFIPTVGYLDSTDNPSLYWYGTSCCTGCMYNESPYVMSARMDQTVCCGNCLVCGPKCLCLCVHASKSWSTPPTTVYPLAFHKGTGGLIWCQMLPSISGSTFCCCHFCVCRELDYCSSYMNNYNFDIQSVGIVFLRVNNAACINNPFCVYCTFNNRMFFDVEQQSF